MNMFLRSTSVAVLALATAGCATAPPVALDPQHIPAAFTSPIVAGANVWPKQAWWKGFASDELDDLIVQARQNNLDLAAASARVLQASARAGISEADLFPSIGLNGDASRRGAKHGKGTNSFGLNASASYEIDFWGRIRANVRSSLETLKSARYAKQLVALTVTADTANSYLAVLALRERADIAQKNVAAAKRILKITDAKVTNGVSSRLDLAQQTALVAGQEATIPALKQQERETRYALAILLGKIPEGFHVKAENLADIKSPVVAPGLPSELLRRRPDVAQAEAQLAAAHANVDAARAAFFPSINLTGSGGYASTALNTLFNPYSLGYSIGASLFQTIFDGGRLSSQSDLAHAQQEELIANYRSTVLNAFADVESALGQVSSLAEQQRLIQIQVDNAQEAFRISEIQYREGVTDLLSVLQSQQTLFNAQDRLVQIRLARIQADIGLYRALGGGWSEDPDDATQPIPVAAHATSTAPAPAPKEKPSHG